MIETIAPDLEERHVYMCGPSGFMDAVLGILRDRRVDLARLHTESFGGVRTSAADKPAPVARVHPSTAAVLLPAPEREAPTGAIRVEFARSGRTARTDGGMPLLDLAESHDVDIGYACRAGTCGECKVRLLGGRVEMACEEGLTPDEKTAGYVLTCVGRPIGDCTLEA